MLARLRSTITGLTHCNRVAGSGIELELLAIPVSSPPFLEAGRRSLDTSGTVEWRVVLHNSFEHHAFGYESPLDEVVAAALEERGWRADTQVGVSGFRVDLGIVHPDKPGDYLAGVECDGATYHRSAVMRDRDKTRQQVLENLGGTIVRAWSTDWWYDPETATGQIDSTLSELLQRAREEQSVEDLDVQADESRGESIAEHAQTPEEPSLINEPAALAAPAADTAITGAELVGPVTRPQSVARLAVSISSVM